MTPLSLLADLVALPAPPGQEDRVRDYLCDRLAELGLSFETDARGNLLAGLNGAIPEKPRLIVAAHMDEIALMVTEVRGDSSLQVAPMGGVFVPKWGEGPVEIWPVDGGEPVRGVLSLGGIHTAHPSSAIAKMRENKSVNWSDVRVFTGIPSDKLPEGVVPGSRVTIARERRALFPFGENDTLIGSYFLDDRADLVAWLLALETLAGQGDETLARDVLFIATAAEEVGGQGALWALETRPAEICVALELGPITPDNPLPPDASVWCWASDGYAAMQPADIAIVQAAAKASGQDLHVVTLSRGGSDASCAAAIGKVARPVTLAFPCENSHGFEIAHRDAIESLAKLTAAVVPRLLHR